MSLVNQIILLQEVDNKLFEIEKLLGDLPSKVEDWLQNKNFIKEFEWINGYKEINQSV